MLRSLTCVLLCALPAAAHAQSGVRILAPEPAFSALYDARSLAMGGTFGAQGFTNDALMGNPAAMGAIPAYRVGLKGSWDPNLKDGYAGVSLVDSQAGAVMAGFGYHFASAGRGEDRRDAHVATAGTAFLLADWLIAGFSSHYIGMTGARKANALTGDGGVLLRFGRLLNLGVSAHNVIPIHNPDFPFYWMGSMSLQFEVVNLAVDARMQPDREDSPYTLHSGLEIAAIRWLPLRGGYSYDFALQEHTWSAGLGFAWGTGSLDLGYMRSIGGREKQQLAASLNFVLF